MASRRHPKLSDDFLFGKHTSNLTGPDDADDAPEEAGNERAGAADKDGEGGGGGNGNGPDGAAEAAAGRQLRFCEREWMNSTTKSEVSRAKEVATGGRSERTRCAA
uniref:Uncharacterized protein n=1 Tax=Zooxanthella nutricula TaxID=1333877 RepID=A0A6U6NH31_9DINO